MKNDDKKPLTMASLKKELAAAKRDMAGARFTPPIPEGAEHSPRLPQIADAYSALETNISKLAGLTERLEARLTNVLRPITPQTTVEGKVAVDMVPLAAGLRLEAGRVDLSCAVLTSILERLEL